MTSDQVAPRVKRRMIALRAELWQALEIMMRDSAKQLDALAEEAVTDLLRKHRRPASLKEALKESTRMLPANDDAPPKRHAT
jgi:hypothetical protein